MNAVYRLGLMTAAVMLTGALMSGCGRKTAAVPQQAPPPPEVGVVTLKPQQVALTTELPGRTSAYLVAEVRPQVGGIVLRRLFTEGSEVKEGEVLYQIDPSTYQAAYASARATQARSEASVVPVRLKAERYKELVAMNAVSRQDFDDVSAQLKQVEADIEVSKAAVETARINLAYTKVTAPISGRIGKSSVTTGALVTASQATPLATIQRLDQVYVDVTQSAVDLLKLKQGFATGRLQKNHDQARVRLILENGAPYPQAGTLRFSDVTVDQTTGSFTVRTVFPNPQQLLLPGMYVRAVLEQGVADRALLVPQQGVSRDLAGNATALVVGAGEKSETRIIKLARSVGDKWLLESGLAAGDRVIVEGVQKARPGTQVKAVPFVPKADAAQAAAAGGPPAPGKK